MLSEQSSYADITDLDDLMSALYTDVKPAIGKVDGTMIDLFSFTLFSTLYRL